MPKLSESSLLQSIKAGYGMPLNLIFWFCFFSIVAGIFTSLWFLCWCVEVNSKWEYTIPNFITLQSILMEGHLIIFQVRTSIYLIFIEPLTSEEMSVYLKQTFLLTMRLSLNRFGLTVQILRGPTATWMPMTRSFLRSTTLKLDQIK